MMKELVRPPVRDAICVVVQNGQTVQDEVGTAGGGVGGGGGGGEAGAEGAGVGEEAIQNPDADDAAAMNIKGRGATGSAAIECRRPGRGWVAAGDPQRAAK